MCIRTRGGGSGRTREGEKEKPINAAGVKMQKQSIRRTRRNGKYVKAVPAADAAAAAADSSIRFVVAYTKA